MKTKMIILGAVITAFSLASFAADPVLSPRAKGSLVTRASEVAPTTSITYVDASSALLTPRARGNEIKVVTGASVDANPALACRSSMIGSPKAVAECSAHTTMPGCAMVAAK
jgi:hypothetical protein